MNMFDITPFDNETELQMFRKNPPETMALKIYERVEKEYLPYAYSHSSCTPKDFKDALIRKFTDLPE